MNTQIDIEKTVRKYILENTNLEENELDNDMDIFEEGLVNSLFAIELMTFIEKSFSIKVGMDDLDMANFRTINCLKSFISRKQEGRV